MIDEERIDILVERLVNRVNKANEYILRKMGNSINEIRKLTPTQAQKLINILKYGGTYEDIVNKLAEYTDLNIKDIEDIFSSYAKEDQLFYKQFYEYRDMPFIPYDRNYVLKSQSQAFANIAENEVYNFSRSNVLGYTITNVNGDVIFKGLRETYNMLLDNALLNVSQGTSTFDEAMTHILKEVGGSGLKTLQYQSGRAMRLDSAIRMHLNGRLRELHYENQKIFGSEFGFDGWEITAHANPAPDHQDIQGRQFSIDEYNKLQSEGRAKDYKGKEISIVHVSKKGNVSHRPIGEFNCRHRAFPIILGVSKPEYTNEQLQEINDKANETFIFDGKEYSMYEATQLQRRIERSVREQKDIQILARETQNQKLTYETQVKINQLTSKYKELSQVSGLTPYKERMKVSGYRRVGTGISKNTITYKTLQNKDFTALENNTKNLINKLNEKELKSLGNYTLEEFEDINKTLANPKIEDDQLWLYDKKEDVWKDINNIDSAIKKATINENITTFRGTASRYFDNKQIGEEFEMPLYFSTSGKESIARDKFMRNISYKENPALLEIKVPKGTNGIYMGDLFNENGLNEFEVLLDRKLKYKVADIKDIDTSGYNEDGIYVHGTKYKKITLEVINDNKRKMGNR